MVQLHIASGPASPQVQDSLHHMTSPINPGSSQPIYHEGHGEADQLLLNPTNSEMHCASHLPGTQNEKNSISCFISSSCTTGMTGSEPSSPQAQGHDSEIKAHDFIVVPQNGEILSNMTKPDHNYESSCDVTLDNAEYNKLWLTEEEKHHDVQRRQRRQRNDSVQSSDSISSSSTEEMFSSDYTDTVSSVDSMSPLIKSIGSRDAEEYPIDETEIKKIYHNSGYDSASSTEALDAEVRISTEEELLLMEKADTTIIEIKDDTDNNINQVPTTPQIVCHDIDGYIQHHLSPIDENEVASFLVQEVLPSSYIQITDKLCNVDESFLNLSQASLWDGEKDGQGKRAVTMQNLHERSSFLNLTEVSKVGRACQRALMFLKDDVNFGSVVSLNSMTASAKDWNKDTTLSLISGKKALDIVPSNKHTKNLLALSLVITLLYIAAGSVRNLQSSLNHEGGVGIISLAVSFVGYMLGSVVSVAIVQNFQPKKCVLVNLVPNLMYIAANIYPAMWLLVPISFLQGVSMAILSNATSTYITFLARGRAEKKREDFEQVSARFYGVFCLIYQSYLIIGNLIASLVLMFGNQPQPVIQENMTSTLASNSSIIDSHLSQTIAGNLSKSKALFEMNDSLASETTDQLALCGSGFCQHFELAGSGFAVSEETKLLLFSIYMGCVVVALLIAAFVLEPLTTGLESAQISCFQKIKCQLISLSKFSTKAQFLLLLPLLMYSVMQFGFISAEVTKAFITCPLGVHMVGYTMICLGVCGSISSYLSGLFTKMLGRTPQLIAAGVLNLGTLVFMIHWKPSTESLVPYFLLLGVWGISDGIWISQVNCLMGVVFRDTYEEAYAGLRVAQGLGVAISFGYSSSLCMTAKIYIMGGMCVLGLMGYLFMELLQKRKAKLALNKWRQTSV